MAQSSWLVAKDCAQQEGIDYEKTFAPTSQIMIVHVVVALSTHKGWHVHQFDIRTSLPCFDLFSRIGLKEAFETL